MPSGQTLLSVVVLGLFCSALAFLCFFALIQDVGPGRATVITYVNPVVAVALGVTLLGEGLGADRRRRAAADPRRLVALHGRAAAARPDDRVGVAAAPYGAAPGAPEVRAALLP